MLVNHFMNRACGDVARNQVPVLRVPLFEEIPSFRFGNAARIAFVSLRLRDPNASAFPACRLGHEAQLVVTGNRRWMYLNEFTVRVICALLIKSRLSRSGADY